VLKALAQPIIPRLSLRPDATSTRPKAIVTTAKPAISHTMIARIRLPPEELRTALDLRKIPAPIEPPKTIRIAEKKLIFFLALGLATNFSSLIFFLSKRFKY